MGRRTINEGENGGKLLLDIRNMPDAEEKIGILTSPRPPLFFWSVERNKKKKKKKKKLCYLKLTLFFF